MLPGNYPSPSNVKIYIGDVYLDDAFRVDWQAQNPKTPMYSWADSNFRTVAQGREIVTGRLIINYRFPGYLISAIEGRTGGEPIYYNDIKNAVARNVEAMATATTEDRIEALMSANTKNDDGQDLEMLQAALKSINSPNLSTSTLNKKPAYQAGAGNPFHIRISYGDPNGFNIVKILEDCHITGESQTISGAATGGGDMSSSGSPIFEVYSFFCRKVSESFNNPRVEE